MLSYRDDVIIVTANYRLGGLGFLGGRAVAATTPDGSAGNFATQDTRAALLWVQRNIASFGGDPARVTIFGESSGASMVAVHLVTPRSSGLFHAAIMESGPFDNFTMQTSCDDSFKAFAAAANCNLTAPDEDSDNELTAASRSLECLRALPLLPEAPWPDPRWNTTGLLPAIAATSPAGWFGPCIDGVEMKAEPEAYAAVGRINPVSGVILGTNQNEGRFLMPFNTPVPNAPISSLGDVRAWLSDNAPYDATPDLPGRILEVYRGAAKTPWEIATLIYTDSQYLCPTARSARWLRKSGSVANDNVFVYRLDYESSTSRKESEFYYWLHWCQYWKLKECRNATMVDPGVGHGSDVGLVWMFPRLNTTDFGLAKTYVDFWQNFAASGNPNGNNGADGVGAFGTTPAWPRYGPGNETLVIDEKSRVQTNAERERCVFWDALHQVPPLPE
jgi:carboxylesterase type B